MTALSPDGRVLVSSSQDFSLRVWDVANGRGLRNLKGHTEAVRGCGHRDASFVPQRPELAARLRDRAQAGDVIITLGAGDITQVGDELLALLGASPAAGARA